MKAGYRKASGFIATVISLSIGLMIGLPGLSFSAGSGGVHNGSVGDCDNCHTVHSGHKRLLSGSDQGSTCLKCHAYLRFSRTVSVTSVNGTVDIEMTAAGDFAWLKVGKVAVPTGLILSGDSHGHNIIAADFGYFQDGTSYQAPGGTFRSENLSCISCHDPHSIYRRIDDAGTKTSSGNPIIASGSNGWPATPDRPVGVYRLLGGPGYATVGSHPFVYPPPDAVAVSNGLNMNVAYGQGMSEWCANCHPALLMVGYFPGLPSQKHPAGNGARLTARIADNYNRYVRPGDPASIPGYSPTVPVEEGETDYELLLRHAITAHQGYIVSTRANVMCLTCHRAHASAWNNAIRWHYGHYPSTAAQREFIERSGASRQGYYQSLEKKYDSFRGMLCNKCHAKD
jgi:predicted CXXCH cytochrome family protein